MAVIRKPHYLKPNKSSVHPRVVIFFDCETRSEYLDKDTQQHHLKLGYYCHYAEAGNKKKAYESYHRFNTVEAFWDETLKLVPFRSRLIFIAHHLDFDFLVLRGMSELKSRGWYAHNLVISGNTDIWKFVQYEYKPASPEWDMYVKHHKKRPRIMKSIVFIDLMNYFKMSLAKLGESMGYPKLHIDFNTCTTDELARYCRNDVYVMVQAWKKWTAFLRENDLGVWAPTLPAQAFNAFRHRFMSSDIMIHSHQKALDLERDAYHGGRTEVFRHGFFNTRQYYLLDVNSMYPAMMKHRLFPTALVTYSDNVGVHDLLELSSKYLLIAECLVNTRRNLFPYKYKGRLCFPLGSFWTCLTTPEIQEGLDLSEIVSVRRLAVYKGDTVFKKYIDFFYNERLKFKASSDSAYTLLTKLFMNSLYGKFGQRIEDYVPIATNPDHEVGFFSEWDADEGKWIRMRKLKGNVEVFLNHVESYNSFPAIAAHVTAYARLYLYTLFHILPYGSFYYCDTDSLIVDERGLKALRNAMSGDKLGYLSLQKESAAIRINNVKDYEFNHRRKIKGVKGASKQTSYNQFTTWHQQSLKSVLWDNKQDKCLWIRTDKNLKQDYHKGIFYPGGDTLPFRFFS